MKARKASCLQWSDVQDFYARKVAEFDLTQAEIAQRGGIGKGHQGQATICKMLKPAGSQGPSFRTLMRAIHGLGMSPASFFAELAHEMGHSQADLSAFRTRTHDAERNTPHAETADEFITVHKSTFERNLARAAKAIAQAAFFRSPADAVAAAGNGDRNTDTDRPKDSRPARQRVRKGSARRSKRTKDRHAA